MSYLHIPNLYQQQDILLFKECYALEKIHGTSSHITWNHGEQKFKFSGGSEPHEKFVKAFDQEALNTKGAELFSSTAIIYGEAYGGKQQGMSDTYGKELKFIAFDIKINGLWLNVPMAESYCKRLGIEFVDYVKCSTDLFALDKERDKDSIQAIRNGIGEGKIREGVVLRPLVELRKNNDERLIAKYKRDEFIETNSPREVREVDPDRMKVLEDANAIADEWVTPMRLRHVLDKMPQPVDITSTTLLIRNMVEDVYREAKGEIVESKEVARAIASRASELFHQKLREEVKEPVSE